MYGRCFRRIDEERATCGRAVSRSAATRLREYGVERASLKVSLRSMYRAAKGPKGRGLEGAGSQGL